MHSTAMLFTVILLVGCLNQIGSDIYAPSLPAIAHYFSVPIDHAQWSMAIFLFAVSLTQLFYGPISEGIGRRPPLLAGLWIMLFGTGICIFASSMPVLLLGRFIQGMGCGAGASLWRSIFRDAFEGEEMAKYGSYLVMLVTFIIPAAPTLGGYIQEFFGWHGNFVFLFIYTLVAIIVVMTRFKETNQYADRARLSKTFIISAYKQILTSRIFMGLGFCVFLCYGAFFSTFTVGPVLFIKHLHTSPSFYGWISFICSGAGLGLAGLINGKLVEKLGVPTMLRFGWSLTTIASVIMLIGHYWIGMNIIILALPFFIFYFGVSFVWPNVFASAFKPFGEIAGYASALYVFMQIGGGAVLGALISYLPDNNQVPLAWIMLLAPFTAWMVYEFIVLKGEKQN